MENEEEEENRDDDQLSEAGAGVITAPQPTADGTLPLTGPRVSRATPDTATRRSTALW